MCANKHTLHPSSVPLNFPILTAQVYAYMRWALHSCFCLRCWNQHWRCSLVLFIQYVCVYAGNICAFRGPTHPPQQRSHEQGSSVCQHGASLTFGVLLKVLMEGTLRGLCPLEPSCVSVSPLLTAYSLFFQSMCVCTGSPVGTGGFGWPTWAGLLSNESLQTGLRRVEQMDHRCKNLYFISSLFSHFLAPKHL